MFNAQEQALVEDEVSILAGGEVVATISRAQMSKLEAHADRLGKTVEMYFSERMLTRLKKGLAANSLITG